MNAGTRDPSARVRSVKSRILAWFIALAIGVGACAGSQTRQTLPVPTAPAGPSTAATLAIAPTLTPTGSTELQTFASTFYGYTMGYPVGWSARGALRLLDNAQVPFLNPTAADRFTRDPAKDLEPLIVIAAQPVPDGTSLEQWGAFTVKVGSPHIECQPNRQEGVQVGGVPAILFIYECGGGFVLWSALVHANLGYDLILGSGPGDEETTDRAVYDRLLVTLAFTR